MVSQSNMERLGFLAICILSANQPFDNNESQIHGQNGWYVPRVDGTVSWMDRNMADKFLDSMEVIEDIELLTSPVTFHLYTRLNPTLGTIITHTRESIEISNFDANKTTYVIIHGWTQSYQTDVIRNLASATLGTFDCNAIVIDWPRARSLIYETSVAAVPIVGREVAKMIDFLSYNFQMSFNNLMVAGHSLGAHVAGFSGKNVKSGRLPKIIAMDAALPLYSYDKPQKRLASTDADYVQAIHTDAGHYGFVRPLGHADFYPNGGTRQPDCNSLNIGPCSHEHSVIYYTEAIEFDNFRSIECENYQQALKNDCGNVVSAARMGAVYPEEEVNGIYYVPVRNSPPYGVLNDTESEY
uniref:Lipase domain-containing protein n=1 Tax=Musca domestica TaxID=7370 RepID=A0A1I8MNL0_MUSDO